jgi:ribosomal protein S18 acetylase RimI-like enzyme
MSEAIELGLARPDEWDAALALLFADCTQDEQPGRIARARAMLASGEIGAADLTVLRRRGVIAGAAVGMVIPGRGGLVWPPRADGPDRRALEDRLARHVTEGLRQRGACLAQALLGPGDAFRAAPLLRAGYRHVTALWYLRHQGDLPPDVLAAPSRLTCVGWRQADPAVFGATLLRTYEDTLDCPEVSGLRTVDDVLAGHRAQGRHDPDLWWLALDGEVPVGVLLLSADSPDTSGWEVAYVGVVPEARRRGHARELVLRALLEARAAGVSEVFLAVDARNHPALGLYRALGFEPFDRREVLLYLW